MRCEICNRSMTELVLDMAGQEHYYCQHCDEEILDTLSSYEEDDVEWWPEEFPDEPLDEDIIEEDQDFTYGAPD